VTHEVLDLDSASRFDRMEERTVSAGHVFILGDDRDDPTDSRIATGFGGAGMASLHRVIALVETVR
jgi:signal peptidase I